MVMSIWWGRLFSFITECILKMSGLFFRSEVHCGGYFWPVWRSSFEFESYLLNSIFWAFFFLSPCHPALPGHATAPWLSFTHSGIQAWDVRSSKPFTQMSALLSVYLVLPPTLSPKSHRRATFIRQMSRRTVGGNWRLTPGTGSETAGLHRSPPAH